MHKEQLDQIREQKDNPLPTPPIGTWVHWFERNQKDACYAALVTAIQGPGKLELEIHKPRSVAINRQGVLHVSHPCHEKRANPASVASGSWDYLPLQKPHKAHFELHLSQLEAREGAMMDEERRAREADKVNKSIANEYDTAAVPAK
jgi:hypothetical protein